MKWYYISYHFGYDDSILAIGAFLEFIDTMKPENQYKNAGRVRKTKDNSYIMAPLEIKPLTISVEIDVKELESNIKAFLQDVLTVALAHLSNLF